MTRPIVKILLTAAAAMVVVLLVAASDPTFQPQAERLLVLCVAAVAIVGLAAALVRAHPAPAVTALDAERDRTADRPPLPSELRLLAGTFNAPTGFSARRAPTVGGRMAIQRLGRERLRARGIDLDRPEHLALARQLAGDHLWAIVFTPPDHPLRGIDLDDALAHLEAL